MRETLHQLGSPDNAKRLRRLIALLSKEQTLIDK